MSPRTVTRHVTHRISPHPDFPLMYSARCLSCGWNDEESYFPEAVDLACMEHAGRSNHRHFERTATSQAFVVRDGEDPVPPPLTPPASRT
ncbi:hypothetical protein CP967_31435 [Streptomyces nitrosporeus]|uniref:DUF7848 domain-containing protein n=1 Tax=Streptomyces nitrosporeus TaxID=28894 RepID=A0A5J6FHS7_9ACTN|nr:hypothetical protein CP967_31435 [Streptomyces nitrosporeus]GGY89105.1 hypothetical protein GCM10010327_19850 [Streptomyces nitrosporeus]